MFLHDRNRFRTPMAIVGAQGYNATIKSMKVVCGTDFSAAAAKAADAAAALVSRTNDVLLLVHVLDLSRYEGPSREFLAYLSEARQNRLKREAQRLRKAAASVQDHLLQGRPAEQLTGFATTSRADLIVVSSRGHTAPIWWPVGSVAERVAFHSSVPTMVVRDNQALKTWISRKRALRVFVGHELCAESNAVLRWVQALEQIGPCQITVAALAWPPQEKWRLGIGDDLSALSASMKVPASLPKCLKEQCSEILDGNKARFRVMAACGRPDSQLVRLACAAKADLIVVGASLRPNAEQGWLGSVSRGIFYYSPFNVVCVPVLRHSDG